MAITTNTIFQGQNLFICDVTWGADGDTTADINHGLIGTPLQVTYTYLQTGAVAATPNVGITTIDATKVTVTKVVVAAGSGAAALGRLVVSRPHSIVR
jgi:hypothetical protein